MAVDNDGTIPFEKILISVSRMETAHPHQTIRIMAISIHEGPLIGAELVERTPKLERAASSRAVNSAQWVLPVPGGP